MNKSIALSTFYANQGNVEVSNFFDIYKSCPTHEANLERVFSKAKNVYGVHRRSLNLETVNGTLQYYYNVTVPRY